MADYNLGTARGVIEIEYRGQGAVRRARMDLNDTGNAAQVASERTSRAGGTMLKAGAVIAGGFALAVKSAADFEKQLSNVEAVSGASASEMEDLRNKALQLGKDTQFSASESAAAIEELVKAGLSVADVMNGAADATVNLAAAGEVSMPEAATIASNAMNQFGLAAGDMVNVADKIAGAANASAIDVSDFGMSLSQVGAVANLAGATFDDTAAAIALMGNAGIKGSDAGTSLKSMLMNLQPQTEKQSTLMEELGIITEDGANKFYDAEGNLKSLADVSGVLEKALKGQTKAQKQATLETIFGSDGIRAAAILADSGAKGFDKMADAMGKVKAADVAATKMDNLAGAVEQMKGSLETLMILIGTPLLKGLRTVVDGITGVLNIILEIPGPVLEAGITFLGLLGGLLLLVGGFLKLKAALAAMRAGMLLFTGPIILIIAAVAALVAAFLYFYRTNAKFKAFVQEMAAVLKDLLGQAIEYLVPKLQQFGKFMKDVFVAILPYLKQFGGFVQDAFVKALPYIKKLWEFVVRFKEIFIAAFAAIVAPILIPIGAIVALVKAFQHFYKNSEGFRNAIDGIIKFAKQMADLFMKEVVPAIQEVAGPIIQSLIDALGGIFTEIQKVIPVVMDFINSFLAMAGAIIQSPAFQFLIDILRVLAQVFVGTILPLLIRVGAIFTQVFVGVIGAAVRTIIGIIRGMLNIVTGIFKVITGILTGNWSKAWEGVKQILRGAVGIIGSILRGLLSSAGAILKGLGSLIVAGVKAIPGLLRGLGGLFLSAGKFIIQSFVDGMKNAAGLIAGIAGNVWDTVRGLLNGAIDKINAAVEFTIDLPGPKNLSVNPPNIPHLATGGVTNGPTVAVVGDNFGGREVVSPLDDLWDQMNRVYNAGRTSTEAADAASRAARGSQGTNAGSGRSRLVEGRLSIDKSGRAYITGVAEDVVDSNERFAAAYGRMG